MQPASRKEIAREVARLKELFPLPLPLEFRQDIPAAADYYGECELVDTPARGRRFRIRLQKGLPLPQVQEVLCHEFAHVLDWAEHHELHRDHGPTWGVWYAHVYREYYGVD